MNIIKKIPFGFISILLMSLLLTGCDQVTNTGGSADQDPINNPQSGDWLIPSDEVVDGGPGKDGIPSVDNPKFEPVNEIDFVGEDRLVIGLKVGNTIKVYPHQILDWHEVINDEIDGKHIAVTHCPLTGTGMVWDRNIRGDIVEFGVSGLLFRNNLIAYDRSTDSHWSQMQQRSVNGTLSGTRLKPVGSKIETTWKQWKEMYPSTEVLNRQTGYARHYRGFAYGESYLQDEDYLIFPVKNENNRLPGKTYVHAIFPEPVTDQKLEVRVFVKEEMGNGVHVINEDYLDIPIVAAGSSEFEFIVSFHRDLEDGTVLKFEPLQGQLPVMMTDQEGNKWNVFGEAVEGPRTGQKLKPTDSYNGYWFAIADMFPNACVYPSTGCRGYIDK